MSKTVKRAMTVMMVGLVAMLGVKAEAHYIVVKGRCYWHSLECGREDKDPGSGRPPASVELVAVPAVVDLLCPNPPHVESITIPSTERIILATPRTRLDQERDTTEERRASGDIISRTVEWQRIVSDALFYTPSSIVSCASRASPMEVIVRTWSSVKMNLYLPGSRLPHSSWEATGGCTLPPEFNFTNLPRGAPYTCSKPIACHEGEECRDL